MLALPRAVRLAAWATAWLQGSGSLDGVVDEVRGGDDVHDVAGLPGHDAPVGLAVAVAELRRMGVRGVRAGLPAPGDPLGLPGPRPLTEAALEAGEAVVLVGAPWAWVPRVQTYGALGDTGIRVTWQVLPAEPRPVDVPTLAEAERLLAEAVRDGAAQATALDVAGAGPATLAALDGLRRAALPGLPPGHGPRATRVAAQALRLLATSRLAAADSGAACSAGQLRRRADLLAPLDRAARRALVAAASAALEPARD